MSVAKGEKPVKAFRYKKVADSAGRQYESVTKCAEVLGVCASEVWRCCHEKGRRVRGTVLTVEFVEGRR